jgi:folate-binding protein YgfZ
MKHNFVQLPSKFISVIGEDAEKFLQGQCSADLSTLKNNEFRFGTLNTPKGRIYGLFKVIRVPNGFLLSLNESIAEQTLQTLKKYSVFFKCQLMIESYYSYGCQQSDADSLQEIDGNFKTFMEAESAENKTGKDGSYLLRIPGKHQLFELWQDTDLGINDKNAESWLAKEALNGIPEIYEATQEQFILQELNLQKLGAVSFKKGCYTGQEIIARMKFLGKLKKNMFLLHADYNDAFTYVPGTEVYVETPDGIIKKAGKLVRAHANDNGKLVALAVLNKELLESDVTARIESFPDIDFTIEELEYDIK